MIYYSSCTIRHRIPIRDNSYTAYEQQKLKIIWTACQWDLKWTKRLQQRLLLWWAQHFLLLYLFFYTAHSDLWQFEHIRIFRLRFATENFSCGFVFDSAYESYKFDFLSYFLARVWNSFYLLTILCNQRWRLKQTFKRQLLTTQARKTTGLVLVLSCMIDPSIFRIC